MTDTQYAQFLELDRHCVTGGASEAECREAVRQKRAIIESHLNRQNPVAREVLEGRTTFVEIYNSYSHEFRGLRRFLPMAHDPVRNERLEHFGKIVPNVRHFLRRSLCAIDNPVTCAIYAVIVSFGVALVWAHSIRDDSGAPGNAPSLDGGMILALAVLFGLAGLIGGMFAMFKYRTRDPNHIRAQEAAAYMDLNYHCYRTFDDEAWAKFIALKTCRAADTARIVELQPASPAHNPTAAAQKTPAR